MIVRLKRTLAKHHPSVSHACFKRTFAMPGRAVVVKIFSARLVFLLDGFFDFVTLEITKRERSTAIGAETTERQSVGNAMRCNGKHYHSLVAPLFFIEVTDNPLITIIEHRACLSMINR
jgi:hypothetical protein